MKKPSSRPIQALLTISALALAAFVLMAVIIPLITDYFLRDKNPTADGVRQAPVVVTPVQTTPATSATSAIKVDADRPTETMTTATTETASDPKETKPAVTSATAAVSADPTESAAVQTSRKDDDITGPGQTDPEPSSTTDEVNINNDSLSYLIDNRIRDIYARYAPMVASIQVYLPGTSSTNDKMETFSGLLVSADGKVITFASNFSFALAYGDHLYERAEVRIVVPGRPKSFNATLSAIHKDTDLAVFRIENVSNLPYANLDFASELVVGEPVISIGQPDVMMSQGGLSLGFITGVYYPALLENELSVSMLQTNAFISQQASGGPLLNLQGEIIGLANSRFNRSYSDIMGYALPTPMLVAALEALDHPQEPKASAWFGILTMSEADNEDLIELMGWPSGLFISQVIDRSPAYVAGIRNGDILLSLNGIAMTNHKIFRDYMQKQPIGTLVDVRIYRTTEKRLYKMQIYLSKMP